MGTAAQNTFFALDNHAIQGGTYDPSVVATDGRAGSLFIQIGDIGSVAPIAVWQKQDNGVSTNWTAFGGSGSLDEFDYKNPVDAVNAIATNVNLAAPGAVINGVTMAVGMRFLVVDQTLSEENGIYVWNGAAVPATRATDANTDAKVTHGMFTWVDGNTGNSPTQRNLTGWILATPDPITLGVTPLSFSQIPINAGQSTRIPGIFWVASNGTDANPSLRGAIAAPFATIQAAINQAVAEGYGNSKPLTVYVMPRTGSYAAFSTSPGISVAGVARNRFMTRCQGVTIVPDGTGINNNTGASISNMQFIATGAPAVDFPAGNPGRWTLFDCRILSSVAGQPCVNMAAASSVLALVSCNINKSGGGAAVIQSDGVNLNLDGGTIDADETAVLCSAGIWNMSNCRVQTTGAFYSIDNFGICQSMKTSDIWNFSAATGALICRAGSLSTVYDCTMQADGPAANYEVEGGGQLNKGNIKFLGSSLSVIATGVINVIPNSEEFTVENHVVTAPEAAAKAFDLSKVPLPSGQINLTCAGGIQYLGPDFVIGGGGYTVDWNGLGMDALPVVAGDNIQVTYWGSPRV